MHVVHVEVATVADYVARREPHRHAHFERLMRLRAEGALIGGGPWPDGRGVDVFYRLARPDQLAPLIEEDPYYRAGAWTGYRARAFTEFVEPWELLPPVLDGSRRATIVEGPPTEPDLAQLALVQLRGAGRLAFGGGLEGGDTLAVLRSAEAGEAVAWLADTGLWNAERLLARPLVHAI
jgi:uncharacterized protein YciI